jgi:ATP-dependent RNA helicase RhlE
MRLTSKGLVLLPTRELAVQVNESLQKVGKGLGLKTALLIGGENIQRQNKQLRQDPHIVIATPGRLIDHLEQKSIRLTAVNTLVLDEADRMLDMGFMPQIKKILALLPKERQTMLFSATMPTEIVDIAKNFMQLPLRVEVAPPGTSSKNVTQEVYFVQKDQKLSLLETILKQYTGSVLVFTRTKFGAKKVAAVVRKMGHSSNEIHSNRSLNQRLEALEGFKIGKYRVLVATDIAARGIDVTGIELVINYDLPQAAEDYVHRIGRTGRASHLGHAISFATPDQKFDVRQIERLIKKQLPVKTLPGLPAIQQTDELNMGSSKFHRSHTNHSSRPPFRSHAQRHQKDNNRSFKKHESNDFTQSQQRGETGKGYFISKPPRPGKFNNKKRNRF